MFSAAVSQAPAGPGWMRAMAVSPMKRARPLFKTGHSQNQLLGTGIDGHRARAAVVDVHDLGVKRAVPYCK